MPKKGKDRTLEEHIQLPVCREVEVALPGHAERMENHELLEYYIKAKLLKKGKLSLVTPIVVYLLGKEEIMSIVRITKFANDSEEPVIIGEEEVVQICQQTKITLIKKSPRQESQDIENIQLYGESKQYYELKDAIVRNLLYREELTKTKLGPIKGVLLGGAGGSGKSTFARKLAYNGFPEHKIHCKLISSVELLSKVVGGAEEQIRNMLKSLIPKAPACLIIEDIHLIFGEKEISANETTLASLFSEMEKITSPIIILATYNSERELSRSIYQGNKFQKEVTLNLPNHYERLHIFQQILSNLKLPEQIPIEDIKQFNLRLNGFSVGEIKQIIRDAFVKFGKNLKKESLEETLKNYRPAEIKELIIDVPEVHWGDIGGYEHVKKEIKKVTELPLKHPQKFKQWNIDPNKGVLLYGPPGCSKTMMAKAIATESKLNFIGIKGPELFSKFVGDSERAIRNIFKKARAFSPCIIFFDQIDALATQRSGGNTEVSDRVLCQLLSEMDGIQGLREVVIVAATNRPEILDKALTRPGRFDSLIYVGPPDLQARTQIFRICLKKTPLSKNQSLFKSLAQRTQNYTGAEITLICRQAALLALEQNLNTQTITQQHFQAALKKVPHRLTSHMIASFEKFNKQSLFF